ncbi:DUF456 domain-containing protein [Mangrovimonas sp. YM274]|uniref:DUF456 domain-containing protein n=1 Tax=Mangrovimonas sp. YM274 TaxID=3070660 RepID=UPI0027DC3CF4|nr:DUF456 domain-containing protein [Mangrovimonas sp. YM274]WMI68587.1 DUF456 domain-containing protein [Mangrovimonas sp. YM274]
MDIFLITIASLCMILGIAGSFLPILPGPLLSWIGLLLIGFSKNIPLSQTFLILTFIIATVIMILDYIIPAVGTKRYGGSRAGIVGTSIGLIIGLLFLGPFGIIIGPFIGALIGELINKSSLNTAMKAAWGSFLGFLASTFMKFVISIVYLGFFIAKLVDNWSSITS